MKRFAPLVALLLVGVLPAVATSAESRSTPSDAATRSDAVLYRARLTPSEARKVTGLGLDVASTRQVSGGVELDLVLTATERAKLEGRGIEVEARRSADGATSSRLAASQADEGYDVWRSFSEEGGIEDEMRAIAAENPDTVKLTELGSSHQGQPILALKVTRRANRLRDGAKPASLFVSLQHAREWISTEVNRRLLHHVLDNDGVDPVITELLDTTELWFVPVANPDGYDYTFTEGNRLWRKNLRDNDGDGQITTADGVDLNRNFPTNWGQDEEGSSSDLADQTYRGPASASEPETRALDGLMERVGFEFLLNYHSYGPLILYPVGSQVQTESADDPIYAALAGSDAVPAIEGFDPGLAADLYIVNGDTTDHAHVAYDTLAYTPELDEGCEGCGFVFPDDPELVQAQFEKNLPFFLDIARSAVDPDDPISHLGNTTPDFEVDAFPTSYGSEQAVQVNAKRSLRTVRLHYSVNGERPRRVRTDEWDGGERYGRHYDTYYRRLRGVVPDLEAGDEVETWFTSPLGRTESEHFTFTVADHDGDALIVAAEDYTGASNLSEADSPSYVGYYADALAANGVTSDVYDVDAGGREAPHPLGVLSHYETVVWETGDDVVTRALGQPGGTAARLANDLVLAHRDHLNEGGRLILAGQFAGFASASPGYAYNPVGDPECGIDEATACIPLSDDFLQYYLGAYTYMDDGGAGATGLVGVDEPFTGVDADLGGPESAENQQHSASFLTTSSFLDPERHPTFASRDVLDWERPGGSPYDPLTGSYYAYSQQADESYKRLTRTVTVPEGATASLSFSASYDVEPDWDYLFVEAHTADTDDWTTLPDRNGATSNGTGESCLAAWRGVHPFLDHYQTVVDPATCEPTGTTGGWNAATGSSGGWQEWDVDLSAYAGSTVEVSISYASDFSFQGLGVFLDDAAVTVDGVVDATSFEEDLGGFVVAGAPEGSPSNPNDWERSTTAFEEGAAVATEDTIWFGFGLEGVATAEDRAEIMGRSLDHLRGSSVAP